MFVSYVSENLSLAQQLATDLKAKGVDAWIDRERIRPGQRWREAIRKAIRDGALFIALFTPEYSRRSKSYMNDELTIAIDELRQQPTDRSWFVPLVALGGTVPDRPIGGGETLRDLQWLDLSVDRGFAIDVIARLLLGSDVPPQQRGWRDVARHVAAYSTATIDEGLRSGHLSVPDHRFEESIFAAARACRNRVDVLSHDDVQPWSAAEAHSHRYQAERNTAIRCGLRVNRVFVVQPLRFQAAWRQLAEVISDHVLRGIGVAVTISQRNRSGAPPTDDFVLFDGGASVVIGGRDAQWVTFGFDTDAEFPASDLMVKSIRSRYNKLCASCAFVTDAFVENLKDDVQLARKIGRKPRIDASSLDTLEEGMYRVIATLA